MMRAGLEGRSYRTGSLLERQQLAVAAPTAQHVARLAGGAEVGVQVRPGSTAWASAWPLFTMSAICTSSAFERVISWNSVSSPFLERQVEHDVRDVLVQLLGEHRQALVDEPLVLGELHLANEDRAPGHEPARHARPPPLGASTPGRASSRASRVGQRGEPLAGRRCMTTSHTSRLWKKVVFLSVNLD